MLNVGFSRVDITPPFGTELTGYFHKRYADGILDPLELNALAVCNENDTILIITGDFMYILEQQATRFRQLISESTGIPMDHILTQAIHQHTSTTPGHEGCCDPHYMWFLERKYCDVAKMALDDLKEATVSVAQAETSEPISFVRRFRMKDGTTATNPGFQNPNIDAPLGKADNTVRLVRFHRVGAKDIALVGFATHPDTVTGSKVSADWPGFVRRMTEEDLRDVHCILVNGCQGDTNHFNVNKPRPSTDVSIKYAYTRHMGRVITDVVIDLWNKTQPMEQSTISAAFVVKSVPSNTDGLERFEECKALKDYIGTPEGMTKYGMEEKGEIRRIAAMDSLTLFQQIPLTMVAFGKIAVVGYGGEPFTEYADVLREAYPDLFILTACNCNGSQGYLPSVSAFSEGGYEARTSNFTPVVAPTMQGAALELLKEHRAKL